MSTLPEAELWSDETIAEFHLNNAMDEESYRWAVTEALAMGVDPTKLNPDHLFQEEAWQQPELYMPAAVAKHRS